MTGSLCEPLSRADGSFRAGVSVDAGGAPAGEGVAGTAGVEVAADGAGAAGAAGVEAGALAGVDGA
jgi:hypothetical protein